MNKKVKTVYVCSECGFESPKWNGRCPSCGQGNTMVEEIKDTRYTNNYNKSTKEISVAYPLSDINITDEIRYKTYINELDRVFGGGIVKGSLVLLGGAPGIGKSTLLLQICNNIKKNLKILYVSGEESRRQIKLRANRLNINNENLFILTETDIEIIRESILSTKPDIVIIDSIQTMNNTLISSVPGSISQVRECTNLLLRISKTLEIPILIIGHVNKDGAIAGPKVLEHIVDVVLQIEGDNQTPYRILRAVKNRHGSTNEICVLEMDDLGLREVENPSLMMLSGRPKDVPGTCVACVMEGTRPILTEVQALVTTTNFGNPRRMSAGFDYNRMSLILAVLEKMAGFYFSNMDVYVNIIGGMKLDEPAIDLAIALSLISSLKNTPINEFTIAFGEIGLTGEIRSVPNIGMRIAECQKLGFEHCIVPYYNLKSLGDTSKYNIKITPIKSIRKAFNLAI